MPDARAIDAYVEITATDNCNCNCSYCFEGGHCAKPRNLEIEALVLERLLELCREYSSIPGSKLGISFWGGEPTLNCSYVSEVVEKTRGYPFVRYHMYSNGTLTSSFEQLASSLPDDVRRRFHTQLSYDGSPHNEAKRGYSGEAVFETARVLEAAGMPFDFKATLSFDMVEKLPEIWQSYKQLADMFPASHVRYAPTLDTNVSDGRWLESWKTAVVETAKLERKFILERGYPLWTWFGPSRKSNCRLERALHVDSSGRIFVCHGAPYEKCRQLRLGDIRTSKLSSLLTQPREARKLPFRCLLCEATHCSVCHVKYLPEDAGSLGEAWIQVRGKDQARCQYFKWFGYVSRLLRLSVMRDPRGIAICESGLEKEVLGKDTRNE